MFDIHRLRDQVSKIFVHQNSPGNPCPDGVASAIILREAIPHATFAFLDYSALDALTPEGGVLFCDLCPSPESAPAWVKAGAYVLDHHATRKDVVALFGERGVFGDQPGACGASLAFEHVLRPWIDAHHGSDFQRKTIKDFAEDFARLSGIRDTWQRKDKRWKEACEQAEALRFWPWASWPTSPFYGNDEEFESMLSVGKVVFARSEEKAKRFASEARIGTTRAGTRVAVIPSTHTSDVVDLLEDVDALVGFKYRFAPATATLSLALSFRSRGGYDVSALAVSLGGGGHKAAAGASVTVAPEESPYSLIARAFDAFEGR